MCSGATLDTCNVYSSALTSLLPFSIAILSALSSLCGGEGKDLANSTSSFTLFLCRVIFVSLGSGQIYLSE